MDSSLETDADVSCIDAEPSVFPAKIPISVEVCLKADSEASFSDVRASIYRLLAKRHQVFANGPLVLNPGEEPYIDDNVASINFVDIDEQTIANQVILFWQVDLQISIFKLCRGGAVEDTEQEQEVASFESWNLPSEDFHGLWESLVYDSGIKNRLLRYAASALLFSEKGVNCQLVSWNRVVLLFGPPGTGKTSLCKALAQKLSIRFKERYQTAHLIEVNAHSLFSKWFSESAKLVSKLFSHIQSFVEDRSSLVFVLIDEVESLAAARQAALNGSDPSDAIRVVNALLTQLDKLKQHPNVMVLTTSNLTHAIDLAFIDRADIKAFIGPPSLQGRYNMLHSSFCELQRAGIVEEVEGNTVYPSTYNELMLSDCDSEDMGSSKGVHLGKKLLEVAKACEGLSGRILRKLPFLAHATSNLPGACSADSFIDKLQSAVQKELEDRNNMSAR
ncbi:unnamed protein product [Closterium sp. Yama58-4]|nr:unnamed protein product [Closterium sp. Yama58-4]